MAEVRLTLKDVRGRQAAIRVESIPPWPGPAAEDQTMTPARWMGLEFMEWLQTRHGNRERQEPAGPSPPVET